jgi:DNA helicase-2/ATP-dependent DNA helicase PcrA
MSERDLEEERRLFYVAITRAKSTCQISYAKSRFRNGKNNFCNPSRFIKDIDAQYLNLPIESNGSLFGNTESRNPFGQSHPERSFGNTSMPRQITPPAPPAYQFQKPLKKIAPAEPSAGGLFAQSSGLRAGQTVEHAIFGQGKIVEVTGGGADARAVVVFENVGQKNLLLKYAKLDIID